MSLPRRALLVLLVGLAVLASSPVLVQFQEPKECANSVEPLSDDDADVDRPVYQYEELSPAAQRAFDRARSASGSVIVTGTDCPAEFTYSAGQEQYEIVKDDSRYVLRTYENDLVPEVLITVALTALLGLCLVGVGLITRDDPAARFPLLAAAVGTVTLVVVTVAVVLGQQVLLAAAGVALVTAGILVATGAAVPPRRALQFAGGLALLPLVGALLLGGVGVVVLVPAAVPLLLVGVGITARQITTALRPRVETP